MHLKTEGVLESSLYVADVVSSAQFYRRVFGFRVISDFGRAARAQFNHRTTATVSSISRSRSLLRS